MRKIVLSALGFILLATLAWAASDPWKDKPYQQWDSRDVQRVLDDSPWARVIRVNAEWKKGANAGDSAAPGVAGTVANAPAASSPPSSGGAQGRSMGGGGSYGGGSGASGGSTMPDAGGGVVDQTPSARFVVRWASSRVMREAFVRAAVLGGQIKEADADKELAVPVTVYQVAVVGPDMTPFTKVDANELKAAAILETKRSKQKVPASEVTLQKGSDGKPNVVLFSFPRKLENGEPAIAPAEKGVEFTCTIGKVTFKASFEISKMADSKGIDL
ncbi:MAG: hypothetical protein WA002_03580 [Candidatus Acidiferrales bacterium]